MFFQWAYGSIGAVLLVLEVAFLVCPGCGTGENTSSSPTCVGHWLSSFSAGQRDWRGATMEPHTPQAWRMPPYSSASNNSTDSLRNWFIFFSSPVQKPLSHAGGDQSYGRHRCWTSWFLKGQNNWEFAALSSQSPKINPPLCLSRSPVSDISILAVRRRTYKTNLGHQVFKKITLISYSSSCYGSAWHPGLLCSTVSKTMEATSQFGNLSISEGRKGFLSPFLLSQSTWRVA